MKKVRKTTRPSRNDPSQIPYDYTVGVTHRFKVLDLIDKMPQELWMEVHDIVQQGGSRPSPRKQNIKVQNGCLRRSYKELRKEEKQNAKEKRKVITI